MQYSGITAKYGDYINCEKTIDFSQYSQIGIINYSVTNRSGPDQLSSWSNLYLSNITKTKLVFL